MNDEITYTEIELIHNKAISYKKFLEEYEQNHIRLFGIPYKFISKYRYTARLTYDEWMTLLAMWIPGEVPEDK